jgi:hypothetical protein
MKYFSHILVAVISFIAGALFDLGIFEQPSQSAVPIADAHSIAQIAGKIQTSMMDLPVSSISLQDQLKIKNDLSNSRRLDEDVEYSIKTVLSHASESEISEGLQLFFEQEELLLEIDDVKTFSSRMIEELGKKDGDVDEFSSAELYFSLSSEYGQGFSQSFSMSDRERLYAHIDVQGGLGIGDRKFFTRWVNSDTGEIMLFKQKKIRSDSERNWISFQPDQKWTSGTYEVSIYQFNSTLNKLSSRTFYIEASD